MIITLCLLILAHTLGGKSTQRLLKRLHVDNWQQRFEKVGSMLKRYAKKVGRAASTPLQQFYYVVTDKETTLEEKALIYGCLLYVVAPGSLIPRKAFHLLGLTDEAAAIALVYRKVKSKINDSINSRVQATLDRWFDADSTSSASQSPTRA